jgi:hypothetical protein
MEHFDLENYVKEQLLTEDQLGELKTMLVEANRAFAASDPHTADEWSTIVTANPRFSISNVWTNGVQFDIDGLPNFHIWMIRPSDEEHLQSNVVMMTGGGIYLVF